MCLTTASNSDAHTHNFHVLQLHCPRGNEKPGEEMQHHHWLATVLSVPYRAEQVVIIPGVVLMV